MNHVTLIDHETDRVEVHLSAEIIPEVDLLLSGQDLGLTVEEIWGDDDYEYWLKIPSEQKDRVLVEFSKLTFQDGDRLRSWLDSRGILYVQNSKRSEDQDEFLIDVKGDFIARDSESGITIVIQGEHQDRMLLLLLQHLFRLKVFKDDTEVKNWLKSKDIPYKFSSYA